MSRQMESQGPDMGRILHRETHSSRAVVATTAAVLVIALAAYGLLEAAVHAFGQQAWLIEPQVAAERLVALPAGISPLLLGAIGAVLAMFGLVFFLNGVLPGRRARLAANVTPEQVTVVVSQRQVVVNVRPTSGVPVDHDAVLNAVQSELGGMALDPTPEVQVNVAPSGVIGA